MEPKEFREEGTRPAQTGAGGSGVQMRCPRALLCHRGWGLERGQGAAGEEVVRGNRASS